jgi:ribose 1,5-bisphosphate isomerase
VVEGDFDRIVDGIRTMRVRGAAAIAVAAADAMVSASVEGMNLDDARRTLLATRPSAVSLHNAVNFVFERTAGSDGPVPDRARKAADEFKAITERARDGVVRNAQPLIFDYRRYMTHCNSTAVVDSLRAAHKAGKRFEVFATETRPWGQGLITVTLLAEAGIDVTLIVDSAARHILTTEDISAVLLGADTVTVSGSLVNKIGTSGIAAAARSMDIPVYVLAESFKFAPPSHRPSIEERPTDEVLPEEIPGVRVKNPVFDVTPAEHITGIVTENGVIDPGLAREVMTGSEVFHGLD